MRYWVIEEYMTRGLSECGRFLQMLADYAEAGMLKRGAFAFVLFSAGIVVQLALLLGLAEVVLKELASDLLGGENVIYA